MASLILFNKPFRVMSQFTDSVGRATLADYITIPDIYPAGRLDYDSEGLLLLTGNGQLQHRISAPDQKMPKTYLVQVEGAITDQALDTLRKGVELQDGPTRPAIVRAISPPSLWPRNPPIRERPSVPTSWIEIVITEGRNRQVRRMTAAAGFPTLRLVRWKIGDWDLSGLQPGESRTSEVHLPASRPAKRNNGKRPTGNRNHVTAKRRQPR